MVSHWHHLVETQSGHVSARNHRFLHKRTLVSIGAPGGDNGMQESLVTAPTVELRCSTREGKRRETAEQLACSVYKPVSPHHTVLYMAY